MRFLTLALMACTCSAMITAGEVVPADVARAFDQYSASVAAPQTMVSFTWSTDLVVPVSGANPGGTLLKRQFKVIWAPPCLKITPIRQADDQPGYADLDNSLAVNADSRFFFLSSKEKHLVVGSFFWRAGI